MKQEFFFKKKIAVLGLKRSGLSTINFLKKKLKPNSIIGWDDDKKLAFGSLGKDVSDVDRERWEAEPSNILYGLDYINKLINLTNLI